jgi:hypothetical protein
MRGLHIPFYIGMDAGRRHAHTTANAHRGQLAAHNQATDSACGHAAELSRGFIKVPQQWLAHVLPPPRCAGVM